MMNGKYVPKSDGGLTDTYLQIQRLDKSLPLPAYATSGSAGLDLYSAESKTLLRGCRARLKTGIAVQIPVGYVGILKSRSGLSFKYWIDTKAGVIDSDYRGETIVCIQNDLDADYEIKRGDKITQMLLIECPQMTVVEVDSLDGTVRGCLGFGSTGHNVLESGWGPI